MTVEPGQGTQGLDPLASQRLELLGKLAAAQLSLEKAIAELSRSGAGTGAADAQLSILAGLQASVGTASATALAAMTGEIATVLAQSKTLADQAREQVNAAAAGSALALADAARASRLAVSDAMEAARHFQLTFAAPADEAAYREREDERTRYIATQNAKNTPEGNLDAAGAGVGQLVDAKAHGAHGPEFDKQWSALVSTTEKLRDQVRASGGSTKEFDDHLRADLRQIMKSKGLTDAEIDARFAANPDPLEAAKAYVQGNDDLNRVKIMAKNAREAGNAPVTTDAAAPAPTDLPQAAVSAASLLKSSGVLAAVEPTSDQPQHGVAANSLASTSAVQRS